MRDYLDTVKEKVIIVKDDKYKGVVITGAVCLALGATAIAVYRVVKSCNIMKKRVGKEREEFVYNYPEEEDGE